VIFPVFNLLRYTRKQACCILALIIRFPFAALPPLPAGSDIFRTPRFQGLYRDVGHISALEVSDPPREETTCWVFGILSSTLFSPSLLRPRLVSVTKLFGPPFFFSSSLLFSSLVYCPTNHVTSSSFGSSFARASTGVCFFPPFPLKGDAELFY